MLLDLEILRAADSRGTTTLPLTTNLNGARTSETLTLPGQSLRFQKRISLPAGSAAGSGWLSIPADGNPRDNAAFFAYGPARPIKSIIVAPAGEAADYLALAAAPPGFGNQSVQRVDPADAATINTGDIATILWAAPLPTGPVYELVNRFLTSGGQVIFFPSGISSEDTFLDLKWSPPAEAPAGKFFILKDWNHSDGPLRDGIDGTPIPAERLKAIRRQVPLGDATALARWEDGEPVITRRIVDHGTAWFVGSLPDYTWSNLGDADVLLPVVQRILAAGADRFDASYLTRERGPRGRNFPPRRAPVRHQPPRPGGQPGNPHPRAVGPGPRRHPLHPAGSSRPGGRSIAFPRRLARLPHRSAAFPDLRGDSLPAEENPSAGAADKSNRVISSP
jgi:hypothetical protein